MSIQLINIHVYPRPQSSIGEFYTLTSHRNQPGRRFRSPLLSPGSLPLWLRPGVSLVDKGQKLNDHDELKAVTPVVHFSTDRREIYSGVSFDSQLLRAQMPRASGRSEAIAYRLTFLICFRISLAPSRESLRA